MLSSYLQGREVIQRPQEILTTLDHYHLERKKVRLAIPRFTDPHLPMSSSITLLISA